MLCFVVDDDSMGYYLMFNIPIVIYFLFFAYTYFAYEHGKFTTPEQPVNRVVGDQEQNLLQNDKNSPQNLSPGLYNKLYQNMRIQRWYFLMYFILIIPNFFILNSTGLTWYSVFTCLHPIVIIVTLLWAIQINAQNLERKSGGGSEPGKPGAGNEGKGTELSDYSSFIDDRSELSVNEGYRAVEQEPKGEIDDKDLG